MHSDNEIERRARFIDDANLAFAALQNEDSMWEAELCERAEWDAALLDDVETDGIN